MCAADTIMVQADSDLQKRLNNLPYFSFGKGLGFTAPDSLYQVNIRFRMQSRGTFEIDDAEKGSIEGQVRQMRLRLDGFIADPAFTYTVQLGFAPGDWGGPIEEGANLNVLLDAVLYYNINKNWKVGFGQTKAPGNRQAMNSGGSLQLTDRSINNSLFNINRDFGAQIHYLHQDPSAFSYQIKGAITQGEGRNTTKNDDLHLAYTGQVSVFPMGSFQENGAYFEGDLLHEEKPKLMLSAAYQFNNKAKKSQGQLGTTLYDPRDLHSIFADAIFKYKGFAFMTAYMQRYTQYPLTFNPSNLFQNDYVMAGHGLDFQSSYLLAKDYELIGRYSIQKMQDQIQGYRPDAQQFTIGLTKYIWKHAFKLQGEATYNVSDYFDNTRENNWYFRFQVEMGI